ncbi:alpha/beta fold hydrolase [Natrononativus amylolyticus]|uniref:alpha/beta fold hydrolase n=1 Tax=Natrononativus amylolyticus TaxID=2963434 RepID=UPI0020CCC854|nr:alpha/beta hydrolase [Natrononativus amylolyticus]
MPGIQCNGANLYYEDHGDGAPIIFLHGATAGLRYFEPQLTGLSDEYRCLAFDFRGHGRSEKTELGHTLPQHARDFHAFLTQLDLDEAVVVGWSMGAIVSWEYIDQFGTDRIRALVDVDMEPSPLQRADYDYGSYSVEGLRDALVRIQTNPLEHLDRQIEALLKDPPSRERRTMMFDESSRTPSPISGAMLLELMRDYRDVLPAIDVPTLVCAGADEKWRSVESVEYAADLIPNARFELFEESGHCLTIEEPEKFNRVVSDFVASL